MLERIKSFEKTIEVFRLENEKYHAEVTPKVRRIDEQYRAESLLILLLFIFVMQLNVMSSIKGFISSFVCLAELFNESNPDYVVLNEHKLPPKYCFQNTWKVWKAITIR